MDGMNMAGGLTLEQLRDMARPYQGDIEGEMSCSFDGTHAKSCDPIFEEFLEHPTWFCDGVPHLGEGGNWKGHVWPGSIFLFWATHWLIGSYRTYFKARRRQVPYHASSTFQLLSLPASLEAWIKSFFPFVTIALEVWLAHASYRRIICAPGLKRAGHFQGHVLNNWQHALMYVGFLFSGWVDLAAEYRLVPKALQLVFLSLAFLCEALLMGLHKKHSPFDIMVHAYLFYPMVACCVAAMCEAAWPRCFLLTCFRIASTYIQGMWFIAAARMLYEGRPAWVYKDGDMAPVVYGPILFGIITIGTVSGMFVVYVVAHKLQKDLPPEVHHLPHPHADGTASPSSKLPVNHGRW